MDPEKRNNFQKLLSEEIGKVQAEVKELKELTQPIAPENAIGRISRMDAINNKSVNEAALRNTENRLFMLQKALGKSDGDDFGICIRCKERIPEARLLRRPESMMCVRCASL